MRIGAEAPLGVGDLHPLQHGDLGGVQGGRRQVAVQGKGLAELPPDRHGGIEGYHRFLEHHADGAAAQLAQAGGR